MRINFKKFVTTSSFRIKFRYVFLFSIKMKSENKGNDRFYGQIKGFFHVLQATALLYFKRFFLQWSVMEHHPKNVM